MSNLTGNEPAMPTLEHGSDNYGLPTVRTEYGLTIRQQFAAMAMTGLLSIYDPSNGAVPNEENILYMAQMSVKASDALINELNKEK